MTDNVTQDIPRGCFSNTLGYIVALIICMIVTLFVGCASSKDIGSYSETNDTLIIEKHDTIERIVKQTETFVYRDSTHTKVVMAANGVDTLRLYETRYIENTKDRLTIDSLRSIIDIMQKEALTNSNEKVIEKPVEKPLKRWQRLLMFVGAAALITALLKVLYIICTRTRAIGILKTLISRFL